MRLRYTLAIVATLLAALQGTYAQDRPAPSAAPGATIAVYGRVLAPDGRPLTAVTVSLLETLDETRTDSIGRFALSSTYRGLATVVARRVGFVPSTLDIDLPVDTALTFRLTAQPPTLSQQVVIAAGEYTIGTGQTASLTPIEVAQMPGAAANIARAIQTLPGAQSVDEGTGLFVRGGDVAETRVLIDDAWMLSPVRFDNPTGHSTTTVDPFLLERTVFSSGGFGAQYGNALSGLVRMESANAPARSSASLTASIGSVSAAGGVRPTRRIGLRAAAGAHTLSPLMAIFGQAQPFDPPPRGYQLSGSGELLTSAAGRIRLFGLRQFSRFGVGLANERGNDGYGARATDGLLVLSWRDSSTAWRPTFTAAYSAHDRHEQFGSFALATRLVAPQLIATLGYRFARGAQLRVGAEYESLSARYTGTSTNASPSTSRPLFDESTPSTRTGGFAEWSETLPMDVRATIGVRTDNSTLAAGRTADPRVSLAWQRGALALTGAWGRYHQVAEPTFRRALPASAFTPMRTSQTILGARLGSDSSGLRVEWFDKRYDALWQFTRGFDPVGDGVGTARGADVQWRMRLGATTRSRITWSHVRTRRTDPNSGALAPSIADITHSAAWITDRTIGNLTLGVAWRYATGRPFTDIVGADSTSGATVPVYGTPFGDRLPAYSRADLSASWYRALGERRGIVMWGSVSNVFGRTNVMRWRWSDDYRVRSAVSAPFIRSVFAGFTLLL